MENISDIMHRIKNKFTEGEVVYERIRPNQKLIVSRFVANLYYCKIQENLSRKELVYFESELSA